MMDKLEIPATPANFTTWYHYLAQRDPELTRTIDVLNSNGRQFSPDVNRELHDRFFGHGLDETQILGVGAELESVMGRILRSVGEAGQDAARFGETLQDFSGQLADREALDDLRQMVGRVLDETRQMEERNRSLEQRLQSSSTEITELRQHLEDSRVEAMTDALTGLANRKHFDLCLRETAASAMEDGQPMSLLMVDVDHFKAFNDRYGHQIGDHALKLVAATLKTNIKGQDMAARYGGEEFAVILPRTPLAAAATLAEQLRHAVASRKLVKKTTGETLGRVTMSLGVAQYQYGEPLTGLVERADACLYAAKRAGRNKVLTERSLEGVPAAANG